MVTKEHVVSLLKAQTRPLNFSQLYTLATGNKALDSQYKYVSFIKWMKELSKRDSRIVIRPPNVQSQGAQIYFRPQYAPPTPESTRRTETRATVSHSWEHIVSLFLSSLDETKAVTRSGYRTLLLRSYPHMFGDIMPAQLELRHVHFALTNERHKTVPSKRSGTFIPYRGGTVYTLLSLLNRCSHFAKHRGLMQLTFDESSAFTEAYRQAWRVFESRRCTKPRRGTMETRQDVARHAGVVGIQPERLSFWARVKKVFTG